ncbi:MAG: hypothetical protein QM805_05525 [Pseudomonas sp.]
MSVLRGRALRAQRRHIGMVFQEYNLVERLTVMENLLSGRLGYVGAWARPGAAGSRRPTSIAPSNCSRPSGSAPSPTSGPMRCRAASASAWASPAR